MSNLLFYIYFAGAVFYSFFEINRIIVRKYEKPELSSAVTPLSSLFYLFIMGIVLFGLIEMYDRSLIGIIISLLFGLGGITYLFLIKEDIKSFSLIVKILLVAFALILLAIIVFSIWYLAVSGWYDICGLCLQHPFQ